MAESKRSNRSSGLHLWEFLLELLADKDCESLISWTHQESREFKLRNQEEVAKRWGAMKRRPGMNYDKLSRALRYYYNKGIIKKVAGQRLVYRFGDLPYEYNPGVRETKLLQGDKILATNEDIRDVAEANLLPVQTEITIKSEFSPNDCTLTQKELASSQEGETKPTIGFLPEDPPRKRNLSAAEQVIADVARQISSRFVIPIYKIQCMASPTGSSSGTEIKGVSSI